LIIGLFFEKISIYNHGGPLIKDRRVMNLGGTGSGKWAALALAVMLAGVMLAGQARAAGSGRYGEKYCSEAGYHCVTVSKNGSWEKLWPDAREREIVMKLNRMNIRLRPGMLIAVPDDMTGKTFMDYSPFPAKMEPEKEKVPRREQGRAGAKSPPARLEVKDKDKDTDQDGEPKEERVGLLRDETAGPAAGEKVIIFDPQLLAWGVYGADGRLVRWGPAVGGRAYCPDIERGCRTRTGVTTIRAKRGPYARSNKYPVGCQGSGCAPVPFFMEFFPGYGFHASKEVPGYHASHGCVRMYYDDAKWLSEEFIEVGTKAIIRDY
jgi:L,D-transpeptidase ErfK/SrfK